MAQHPMRAGWKSIINTSGEQYVMTAGMIMMHTLSVHILDMGNVNIISQEQY